MVFKSSLTALFCVALTYPEALFAQDTTPRSRNLYGITGLIDMPSGQMQPDANVTMTLGHFGGATRGTFTFQVTPRLEASFRYSQLEDIQDQSITDGDLFDRSFDFRYQITPQTTYWPAITVGVQDFGGTGIYASEYVVGTKDITPDLTVTGGIGWGRIAGVGSFANPLGYLAEGFNTRPGRTFNISETGNVNLDRLFRGEAALFAGAEWRVPDMPLTLKVEYSPDNYTNEVTQGLFERRSSLNFGAEYALSDQASLGLYYMYGSEIGLNLSVALNPRTPIFQNNDEAPAPILRRTPDNTVFERTFGDIRVMPFLLNTSGQTHLPQYTVTQPEPEYTVARVSGQCQAGIAREIAALNGAIDLVTFSAADGQAECTYVITPKGQSYQAAQRQRQAQYPAYVPDPQAAQTYADTVSDALQSAFIDLENLILTADSAQVWVTSTRYNRQAQLVGRTARAMSRTLPAAVESFIINVVESDLPVVQITLQRTDLEQLEFAQDPVWTSFIRAKISDAPADFPIGVTPSNRQQRNWDVSLSPYASLNIFDPDSPFRGELGWRIGGGVQIARGVSISGSVAQAVVGNIDQTTRESNSVLPRVRTDIDRYQRERDVFIERLTADALFKVTPDIYGRVSAGYLEAMYAGVSAEFLWKPANSRLGFGVEANYVTQRAFDGGFGLRDYSVATGHGSLYWDFADGFYGQVDVGRYLAGDVGATFSLKRTFANGWSVGGYFSLTDVSFEDFGEGSFDKGITVEIPLSWATGASTRSNFDLNIRPVLRDGGARLNVANRLYDIVEKGDGFSLGEDWGQFWR